MLRAALFDLDGTLVDSELQTDLAILTVMDRHGHPEAQLPPAETRGRTWADIVQALMQRYGLTADPAGVERELLESSRAAIDQVSAVPGAAEALREAADHMYLAVVSSSPRDVIDRFLERLEVATLIPEDARIGADDIRNPKPDPEGFLLAARRFGVKPDQCIVFEDSQAGLRAARTAGMKSMVVLQCCAEPEVCRELATCACTNFRALPRGFWAALTSDPSHALQSAWLE
jgi:HAD superfamily hydrolase (TIGR01509 family)